MTVDMLPCSSLNLFGMSPQKHESGKLSASAATMPSRFDPDGVIGRTVVLAVINRLQQWCCKLLWFTIVCVMGCCGDLKKINNESQTMSDVRRTIVTAHKVNRSANTKTVLELEMQLLRHLTSPQTAVLRPTKPANKHQLSRPPSPQLFDICEDDENLH